MIKLRLLAVVGDLILGANWDNCPARKSNANLHTHSYPHSFTQKCNLPQPESARNICRISVKNSNTNDCVPGNICGDSQHIPTQYTEYHGPNTLSQTMLGNSNCLPWVAVAQRSNQHLVIGRALVQFPSSAWGSAVGQDTKLQTAPHVLVGTLHWSHQHQCINVCMNYSK